MSLQLRFDSAPRAFCLAGEALPLEFLLVRELLKLHPFCAPSPENFLIDRLPELARYTRSEAGKGARTPLESARERILKGELGNGVLRYAAKLTLPSPESTLLLSSNQLRGIHTFFDFFPNTPLVLLSGSTADDAEVLKFATEKKAEGAPVSIVQFDEIKSDMARALTRILDFAGLTTREYNWSRAELFLRQSAP